MSLPVWHIIMLKCYLDCSKISKTFKCIIEIHQNNYVTLQPVYNVYNSRVNIMAKKPYFFLNRDIPDPYFFLNFCVRVKRVYYNWGPGGAANPARIFTLGTSLTHYSKILVIFVRHHYRLFKEHHICEKSFCREKYIIFFHFWWIASNYLRFL